MGDDVDGNYDRMKLKVNEELKQHFRPEFLNRLDDVIVFHQLTRPEILQIVDLMAASLDDRLKDKDMGLILTDQAKELLVDKGYDQSLGARPMRRTIQREIEDVLSEKILFGELTAGNLVVVGVAGEAANADKKTADTREFTFTGEVKQPLPDAPPVNSAAE
jgi:ATP-dependent Clp protease ATP-binding subunit ClpC